MRLEVISNYTVRLCTFFSLIYQTIRSLVFKIILDIFKHMRKISGGSSRWQACRAVTQIFKSCLPSLPTNKTMNKTAWVVDLRTLRDYFLHNYTCTKCAVFCYISKILPCNVIFFLKLLHKSLQPNLPNFIKWRSQLSTV